MSPFDTIQCSIFATNIAICFLIKYFCTGSESRTNTSVDIFKITVRKGLTLLCSIIHANIVYVKSAQSDIY